MSRKQRRHSCLCIFPRIYPIEKLSICVSHFFTTVTTTCDGYNLE